MICEEIRNYSSQYDLYRHWRDLYTASIIYAVNSMNYAEKNIYSQRYDLWRNQYDLYSFQYDL